VEDLIPQQILKLIAFQLQPFRKNKKDKNFICLLSLVSKQKAQLAANFYGQLTTRQESHRWHGAMMFVEVMGRFLHED
jgi:hypothetical protein